MGYKYLLFIAIVLPTLANAGTETYYVEADSLNVRLGPEPSSKITNKIYRQQKLDVYEVKDGWARISEYYDGTIEGISGNVARWVSVKYLSKARPNDLAQPNIEKDPRINGIPKVGQYGMTEKDVNILHKAAKHYLDSGKCKKIEYGDKSTSKPNTYYLNCGGPKNLFFKPSDIPDV